MIVKLNENKSLSIRSENMAERIIIKDLIKKGSVKITDTLIGEGSVEITFYEDK